MVYTVKNVKTFRGMEGQGFECSLYKDGKKIGTVTDDAQGGPYRFFLKKGEEEILQAHAKTLPKLPWGFTPHPPLDPDGMTQDADIVVNNLVEDFLEEKRLRKMCKSKIIFTLHSDKGPVAYWEMKNIFSPKMRTYLQDKYGDDLKEIINERYQ